MTLSPQDPPDPWWRRWARTVCCAMGRHPADALYQGDTQAIRYEGGCRACGRTWNFFMWNP